MIQKLKKIIAITSIASMLLFTMVPANAYDIPEVPTLPPAPETTQSQSSSAPTPPPAPENEDVAPTPPPAPTLDEVVSESDEASEDAESQAVPTNENTSEAGNTQSTDGDQTQETQSTSGVTNDGKVGDTDVTTGDANNTGNILTSGNLNTSGNGGLNDGGSVEVINSGNGSGSENTGSVTIDDNTTTVQDNLANVFNTLNLNANSGNNSASKNVGDASITTGDANVSGTIITAVNTNVDGVAVAEFTVADDYVGDLVLDFTGNCIAGCGSGSTTVTNENNGSDSTNSGDVTQITNNDTFQNNDATIENSLTLDANSGENIADKNTGGDSEITTGDANVSANVLTFANNNIAGNVIIGIVNIFGDLIGDIILPQSSLDACCGNDGTASNTGNGANSTNTGTIDQATNNETFQSNDATIENNLLLAATTGGNSASGNTGGDSSITTGDSKVDLQAVNIANSNIDGGTWWLVIVNEAGQWIGHILGMTEDSNFAGSSGTEFQVGPNGEILATNSGNGSGSTNTASVDQTTNNTTVQTNTAHIVNNLDLSANTGGNSTSKNTGGSNAITTGDANVIANLVNFVNNNISGNGKLVVTVVNVFGSWFGDFVAPGQKKEKLVQETTQTPSPSVGGPVNNGGGEGSQQNDVTTNNQNNESNNAGTSLSSTVNVTASNGDNGNVSGSVSHNAGYSTPQVSSVTTGEDEDDKQAVTGAAAGKKKLKINLAYILLLLPFLGFIALRRKILQYPFFVKSYIIFIILFIKKSIF